MFLVFRKTRQVGSLPNIITAPSRPGSEHLLMKRLVK